MTNPVEFNDLSDWLNYWFVKQRLSQPEQSVLERYYHSFISHFGPYLRKHYASQIHELEEIVIKRPGCRILEIGCGCGTESIWLGLLGASVLGIDLQRDRLNVANARLEHTKAELNLAPDVEFRMTSVFDTMQSGPFDIVWMEQAFHHIEPRTDFIELLTKLVSPDGTIVISEANAWNPLIQLQLLLQRGFKTVKEYKDKNGISHIYGNERIITAGCLARKLEQVGFTIKSIRYYRIFPNLPWAERFAFIESVVPRWLKPAFTHYNLVAEYSTQTSE